MSLGQRAEHRFLLFFIKDVIHVASTLTKGVLREAASPVLSIGLNLLLVIFFLEEEENYQSLRVDLSWFLCLLVSLFAGFFVCWFLCWLVSLFAGFFVCLVLFEHVLLFEPHVGRSERNSVLQKCIISIIIIISSLVSFFF